MPGIVHGVPDELPEKEEQPDYEYQFTPDMGPLYTPEDIRLTIFNSILSKEEGPINLSSLQLIFDKVRLVEKFIREAGK